MSVFEPVKMRSLEYHYTEELLPIVRNQFRHVTKPFVDIPGATEAYLKGREFIRRLKGLPRYISVTDKIREEYVRKYPDYNFPGYVLAALVDYSVYRYFVQIKELRPWLHIEFAEDIIRVVQQNKEFLLSEFIKEKDRKKEEARDRVARSLRKLNISALKATRPSIKISEFIVGKKKRTQKRGKGKKRRRRSKTGKIRR